MGEEMEILYVLKHNGAYAVTSRRSVGGVLGVGGMDSMVHLFGPQGYKSNCF